MIRRYVTELRLMLVTFEATGAALLFVAVSVFRFGAGQWQSSWSNAGMDPWLTAAGYGLVWVSALWLHDLYRLRARWTFRRDLVDIVRAGVLVSVATFALLFIAKLPDVSRLFLLFLFTAQVGFTLLARVALRVFFAWARERGYNTRYVLVVGTGPAAQSFADRIERHRELGLKVIGHLDAREEATPTVRVGRPSRPVLGSAQQIETILHSQVVDEVAICLDQGASTLAGRIARLCEDEGRIVRIPLPEGALMLPGGRLEEFDGMPVLSLVNGPDRAISLVAKRTLDIVLSAGALVALSPVLLAVAAWIAAHDGRPVLFRQTRVGLHGRPFDVVKFRTMVPGAEAQVAELEALNEIKGHAFKVTDDPRLSRTGGILRRTSLDELPQLWNVFRGEMSLVGPRPPLPREVANYDVWHRRRLSMKPGITGLWQVAARREVEFDRWVAMDLDYIDGWSLWLDVRIMLRTVPAMLEGR